MGREKLCEIYGNGKTTQLLNRAVRAEIPGGEQVFEALKIANKRRSQGEDDGMEIDGGQLNSRVYQNRIERFYCGVSLAPNQTGPSYLFRNLIVNLGTTYNDRNYTALKIGGSTDKVFGMHYLFIRLR